MALKITYQIPNTTLEIENAYLKVSYVTRCNTEVFEFFVSIYASESDRVNGKSTLPNNNGTYSVHSNSPIFATYFSEDKLKEENISPLTQAYAYLKALPEFENAIDC